MLDAASKAFFQTLSYSRTLKKLASRYGIAGPHAFARRFIAGETVDDAIAAVRTIEARGLHSTWTISARASRRWQPPKPPRANI